MSKWGREMYITPGTVVDGELVTTDLADIKLNIRILLGSSYHDDWHNGQTFIKAISWISAFHGIRPQRRVPRSVTLKS